MDEIEIIRNLYKEQFDCDVDNAEVYVVRKHSMNWAISFAEWVRYSCFSSNNPKMSTEELYVKWLKGNK